MVSLIDLSELTKLAIKVSPSQGHSLPIAFGTGSVVGEVLVCGTRPREWMVLGQPEAVAAVVDGIHAYVIDLTHSRLLVEVAGTQAAATLEKLCGIDFSDPMMPNGAVTSASVAKINCDLVRTDREDQPAYLIMADRSYGQYLYDALADAATEFLTRA